ncbi:MAG: hypothetical protein H6Q20_863 [Bacteroidetes bacterium]|nr:hypothetical protein [Bacteroidota bacterium]
MCGRAKSLKLVLHLAYYSTVLTCLEGNIFHNRNAIGLRWAIPPTCCL